MGSGYAIARAIEQLRATGFGPEVWGMTPRQLNAYVQLGYRRRLGWLSEVAGAIRIATAGDKRQFAKYIKKLTDESA